MGRDKATGKVSKENSNKDFKVFLEKTETGPPRVTESPGSPFSDAAAQPSLGLARERGCQGGLRGALLCAAGGGRVCRHSKGRKRGRKRCG